jgi:hypothetical protein
MDRTDQAGIEELHRNDVAATLASDPKIPQHASKSPRSVTLLLQHPQ